MEHNTNVDIAGAGSAELADNLDFSQMAGAKDPGAIFAPSQELKEDEDGLPHSLEATFQSLAKLHTSSSSSWIIALEGARFGRSVGVFVQETIDSEFIVIGGRSSEAGGHDVFFAKVNTVGTPLWVKAFGGVAYGEPSAVQNTVNGKFIITGTTEIFGKGNLDIFLVKTDSVGTPLWAKVIIETGRNMDAYVQETTDGGFIISGSTGSFEEDNRDIFFDIFLFKVDSVGTFTWAKVFGGTDNDYGRSTLETTDNGFIVAGYTESFGAGARERDIFLTKMDNEGNLLWSRILGGAGDDAISRMQKTADGGFITIGSTASFEVGGNYDIFLGKFNNEGILVWAQALGGTDLDNSGMSVQETADGGFIIAGFIVSEAFANNSIFVAKVNNEGDLLWAQVYGEKGAATCVQETSDGGFIITGAMGGILLAKVTVTGEVPGCSIVQDITALLNVTNITSLLIVRNVNPTVISINPNITDITHSLSVQNISLTETKFCSGSNSGPTIANFIPDQTIQTEVATSFQFNANTFIDPDGDSLTYSATLSDGSPLPGWITFVSVTRTFNFFYPMSANKGSINLKVIAADGYGGTVADIFAVVIEGVLPVVANPIPDQAIAMEKTTVFQFNTNAFNDPKGGSLILFSKPRK